MDGSPFKGCRPGFLVYAFRKELPQHAVCRAWLHDVVLGKANFGLSPLTLSALVRVTTSKRIYSNPSSLGDAFGFCEDLLAQPHCRIVEPGERHWDVFKSLCVETNTRGPTLTDVWYAALAIESGCEWITLDRDYARFPGLRWRMPTP
jgi:hypothetical protein